MVQPAAGRRRPAGRLVAATTRGTRPRLRSAVLRRRSATVRTDTAYACAAQEESAPVLVAGDHHLGVATLAGLVISGLSSASGSGSSTGAFQNDDYQVPPPDTNPPPIPLPQTYEQAEQWITNSRLYNQTVPVPVRCNSQPINVTTASDAQLESHFEGLMECLVRVWEPPVTNARFVLVRPTVTIYGRELTTKCGRTGVNAFYCTADQQVYYSNLLPQALPGEVRNNKWTADIVMAHEFGHAVQGRTGILVWARIGPGVWRRGDRAGTCAVSRRKRTVSPACSYARYHCRWECNNKTSMDPGHLRRHRRRQSLRSTRRRRKPRARPITQILGKHWHALQRGWCNTFVAEARLVR